MTAGVAAAAVVAGGVPAAPAQAGMPAGNVGGCGGGVVGGGEGEVFGGGHLSSPPCYPRLVSGTAASAPTAVALAARGGGVWRWEQR